MSQMNKPGSVSELCFCRLSFFWGRGRGGDQPCPRFWNLHVFQSKVGFLICIQRDEAFCNRGTKRRSNIMFPVSEVKEWRRAHRGWNPGSISLDSVGIKPGVPVRFTVDEDANGKRLIAVGLEILKQGSVDPIVHFPGSCPVSLLSLVVCT